MSNKVSIIVPVYNAENTISRTVDALLNQSYRNTEIIIVDDKSTDNSTKILKGFSDERIRLIIMEKNNGVGVARNIGLGKATGRYVAFCDSDDVWNVDKLQKQISFMASKKCSVTYTSYFVVEGGVRRKVPVFNSVNYSMLLLNNWIGCSTVVIDKEIIKDFEFSDMRKRQDWLLWLRLARIGVRFYGIQEALVDYYIEKNSLSRNKSSLLKENFKVYHSGLYYSKNISRGLLLLFLCIYVLKKTYYDLYNRIFGLCRVKA